MNKILKNNFTKKTLYQLTHKINLINAKALSTVYIFLSSLKLPTIKKCKICVKLKIPLFSFDTQKSNIFAIFNTKI